jgi:hypothetical protein
MKDRVRELIQADVAGWKRGEDILETIKDSTNE